MSGLSNSEELAVLDARLPASTNFEIGLHTADPGDNVGTTAEVSGNGYVRATAQFAPASHEGAPVTNAVERNSTVAQFPQATGTGWGTLTHFSVWRINGDTTRTYVASGQLVDPNGEPLARNVDPGVSPSFSVGTLRIIVN